MKKYETQMQYYQSRMTRKATTNVNNHNTHKQQLLGIDTNELKEPTKPTPQQILIQKELKSFPKLILTREKHIIYKTNNGIIDFWSR